MVVASTGASFSADASSEGLCRYRLSRLLESLRRDTGGAYSSSFESLRRRERDGAPFRMAPFVRID